MKYKYRVKHYRNNNDIGCFLMLGCLLCPPLLILAFLLDGTSSEWWEVLCKVCWLDPWRTCITEGGIPINSKSKDEAIKDMEVLKENNVGFRDFKIKIFSKKN